MKWEVTDAFDKIFEAAKNYKIIDVQGGAGAGKTYAIEQLLFLYAKRQRLNITIMSDTYDNLLDTNIRDFKSICASSGFDFDKNYKAQAKTLIFENGSEIQFRYMSDNKPTAGKGKRRDILYIDECNRFAWNTVYQYVMRTHKRVFFAYNPDFSFWNDTELPKLDDKGKPLTIKLILTHKDNHLLPQLERKLLLNRSDNDNFKRVYIDGLTGYYSDKQIYTFEYVDNIPTFAQKIYSGMDFGISPDPTCLVELYLDKSDLYCELIFSENGLMPEKIIGAERSAIVDRMDEHKVSKGNMIIADSAGAIEIRDLRKHGYKVQGVKKGTGSQMRGINKLRGYNIKLCTKNPKNKMIADQIGEFFFKTDKHRLDQHGNQLVIPEVDGHEPDALVSIRYAVMKLANRLTDQQNKNWKTML